TLTPPGVSVLGLAAASGRPLLAVARFEGGVEIWDTEKRTQLSTFREHRGRVWSVALSADGRMLASGGDDGILYLSNTETGKVIGSYPGHSRGIKGVAFSLGSNLVAAACNDATIRLWDWNAKAERVLIGHTREVNSVQFAPDGKTLVSAGADGTLRA